MLIDSHCHLDMLTPVKEQGSVDAVLAEAKAAGIEHFLCVCVGLERYAAMRALVESYANVDVSVGLHPCGSEAVEPSVEMLVEKARDEKVVALGETGLDYYYDKIPREVQQQRFRNHIRAGRETGKPVIVHTRDARADTIKILTEEKARECGGVIHCFTEDWDTAKAAMDLGFYISFSGIVTFRNAASLRDVARRVPDAQLLVETDAPYLAPVPKRGKENTPAYVRHVAECVAAEREQSLEQVAEITSRNYRALFG